MKLHILSDVHLEFGKWPRSVDINAIDADVTVLAGDISVGLEGLQWAMAIKRPVIYVMGNHEFYGQRPMMDLWRKASEKVAGTHVHLLENQSVVLDDPQRPGERVRFLGASLWTDFGILDPEHQEAAMDDAARNMTDFKAIYVSRRGSVVSEPGFTTRHVGDRLTPAKTVAFHQESRDFLESELERKDDAWHRTVVVTHHAPSARSLKKHEAVMLGDAAYASHLDHLVVKADLWIHGHTHVPVDYRIGDGRVLSNPRGYVGSELVANFDPGLVIAVV